MNDYTKPLFILVMVLCLVSLGVSMYSIGLYSDLRTRYQTSLEALQEYQMINFLRVEYVTKNVSIQLDKIDVIKWSRNDSTIYGWDYFYAETELGLQADFKYIFLEIYIPSKAIKHYQSIVCAWIVENSTGQILKPAFSPSTKFSQYHQGIQDISRYFWKDQVPSQISLTIKYRV